MNQSINANPSIHASTVSIPPTFRWDPLSSTLLGGFQKNDAFPPGVHVVAEDPTALLSEEEYTTLRALLVIPLPMYLAMMGAYIEAKMDYCDRYGAYCGAMGAVECTVTDSGATWAEPIWNETAQDYEPGPTLPILLVTSFDGSLDAIDMEHG